MAAKFEKLKEELKSLEQGDMLSRSVTRKKNEGLFQAGLSSPKWLKRILLIGFLGAFMVYAGITYVGTPSTTISNPFTTVESWTSESNQDLLQRMGTMMEELGYTDLSQQDLIELREQGVTATFTTRMHDLGYTELTLDQLVRLRQNDVSSTFAAMMKELGYDLSADQLVELRQHDVTAYYTSNLHDMGYTEITPQELIRLKDTGVETSEVQEMIEQNGENPTIEEMIRYRISNQ